MRALMLVAVVSSSLLLLACPGPKCSAATCATGCCDAAGECQPGSQPLACGIAGGTCNACVLGQQCLQGVCFGGSGAGGGTTGGGGGATGGGGGSAGIRLIPMTATVPVNESVELSAELTGGAPDQQVNWTLISGGGQLNPSGPSTATYRALSASATVRIRAQANYLSSVATFADFSISTTARPFIVGPSSFSSSPFILAPGTRQTFGTLRVISNPSSFEGLRGVEWTVWPAGAITDGTLVATAGMQRVYAREASSNVWGSTGVSVESTVLPSVEITPSLATVAANGVVQFTANISTGQAAEWQVPPGHGVVSASGTYTAPAVPGVYLVEARPLGAGGSRAAVATIIVQ